MGLWSPNLKTIVGEKTANAPITAIYDFGGGALLKNPVSLTWQEGKRFGWSGGTLYGPDVYDNHQFMLVPLEDDRTLFVHTDDLTSTSLAFNLEAVFVDFFQGFNQALKAHVESLE